MLKHTIAAALAGVTALALTACGQTTDDSSAKDEAPRASAECDGVKTSTDPVSMTDAYGRTIELDKPAERVAVLEWQQTEDLLTLCVAPVAVADAKGFSTWVTSEELPAETKDVGTRGEPNLEALFATDPDLIVVEAYTAKDDILKQLAKYDVPVLATKGADAKDPIAQMKSTFELIAEATGREEHAEDVLDDFDSALEEAKETIADSDAAGTEFVYFDGYVDGANVAIRPYGQGSLVGELGEELGLKNVWTGQVDPAYGLGQTDIEGMTKVGDATFFYTGTSDPANPDSDVDAELAQSKVWTSIPAVSEDRTYAFPGGIWTFGGPRSATQMVDAYVSFLTK
ncbi:iron-siderophore ABC transporter substrate-binding protein [Nocardioides jishulii]|uniref:Iron-siderophore ABC transporter substrate-binding protein n=1 Tax=Nocardioides jishulii TaxID=2575440 RepID=A0A4U2YIU4_9ACTN|nr:iron-siderophore ABC transporter substrate-binding protein [Nocardioides jishulii]QCX28135.1 iron-siderophore ABC transporter substrate-binding protein [Nocardioides jishulii]TKI60800.1 iron-siderophore ABC transporter substrate-binding protein [Nocardioides jishulii]